MPIKNIIFHIPNPINCNKYIVKSKHFYKHNNTYLIPYICNYVNHTHKILDGNFVYPMWNTLQRSILTRDTSFSYSYISRNDILIEFTSTTLTSYRVLNNPFSSINICKETLYPNSMFLFPINRDVAETLIENGLL